MKYYVVADIHGFFTEMEAALRAQGYFEDPQPHKLILCGDLFDRGPEAVKMQSFILEGLERGDVILIRGNHEDLLLDFLRDLPRKPYIEQHHLSNGTGDTACQLTGTPPDCLTVSRESVGRALLHGPLVRSILPAMVDYYETEHYIFVHGWIPCLRRMVFPGKVKYVPLPDWRGEGEPGWREARWTNGMEAARNGILEPGKTIVCGHWHTSFGHAHYEGRGGEFDRNPDFSPYYAPGIIALDGCTVHSGQVNCIVLED